jgi:hypothetical protein
MLPETPDSPTRLLAPTRLLDESHSHPVIMGVLWLQELYSGQDNNEKGRHVRL